MTLEAVQGAIAQLRAAGREPSLDNLHAMLGGSRRDVVRLRKEAWRLAEAPAPTEITDDPAPTEITDDPAPSDPVAKAEQALKEAEDALAEARYGLTQFKIALLATRPLHVDGVLHGSLHPADELHREALEDVDHAKRLYDHAWQQREAARATLTQATQAHRRHHQERWVQVHQPGLAEALEHWQAKLLRAANDRDHAHAKKEHAAAMMAYQNAIMLAPLTMNGNGKGE